MARRTIPSLVLALLAVWVIPAASAQNPLADDAARIQELVRQLGSPKFSERERAKKDLEAIGGPALSELRKAASGEDLETSKRATELVRKIEERQTTAEILTPKRVRLELKEVPVADAVRRLAAASGYDLQLQGDLTRIAGKKITLDTGNVSFWEALDRLCEAAGLNEVDVQPVQTVPGRPGIIRPQPVRPPVKVLPIKVQPIKAKAVPIRKVPARPAQPRIQPAPQPEPAPQPVPRNALQVQAAPAQAAPAQAAPAQAAPAQAAPAQAARKPAVQVVPVQAQPAVPPAPPPVQIQIQGGQIQIQPGIGIIGGGNVPIASPDRIVLQPGTVKKAPTSYAGSVRVRALPSTGAVSKGQVGLTLEVDGEPRLQNFGVVGTPTIHKAVDENGQELRLSMEQSPANPMVPGVPGRIMILPANRLPMVQVNKTVPLRLEGGEKPSTLLKELSGTLNCQAVRPNQVLAKLDDVLKAAGKSVDVKDGGTITLNSIEKTADGKYKLALRMANMQRGNPFGGRILINGNVIIQNQVRIVGGRNVGGLGQGLPELVDAQGRKYSVEQIPSRRSTFNNGQMSQELTVIYGSPAGAGEPRSLILNGEETVDFQVPFHFTNVPLGK